MKTNEFFNKENDRSTGDKNLVVTSVIAFLGILTYVLSIVGGSFPNWITIIFSIISIIMAIFILNNVGLTSFIKKKLIYLKIKIIFKRNKKDFLQQLDFFIEEYSHFVGRNFSYSLEMVYQDNSHLKLDRGKLEIIQIWFEQFKSEYIELK